MPLTDTDARAEVGFIGGSLHLQPQNARGNLAAVCLGRSVRLTGQLANLSPSVLLRTEVAGHVYTRTLDLPQQARFDWLPLLKSDAVTRLSAADAAGDSDTPVGYGAP